VNVEHLLGVFTSTEADSGDIWDTCYSFMRHLYWHKPQLVMLGVEQTRGQRQTGRNDLPGEGERVA